MLDLHRAKLYRQLPSQMPSRPRVINARLHGVEIYAENKIKYEFSRSVNGDSLESNLTHSPWKTRKSKEARCMSLK